MKAECQGLQETINKEDNMSPQQWHDEKWKTNAKESVYNANAHGMMICQSPECSKDSIASTLNTVQNVIDKTHKDIDAGI